MSFQLPLTTTWKIWSGTIFGWRRRIRSAGRRSRRTGQAPTKGTDEKHIWELFGGEKNRFWDKATDSGQWRVAPAPWRL